MHSGFRLDLALTGRQNSCPMARKKHKVSASSAPTKLEGYSGVLSDVVALIEAARHEAARSVNAVLTATYWMVGRRIVVQEQGGSRRAKYGKAILKSLSADLTTRFGRGFSVDRLETMRLFYLAYPPEGKSATVSRKSATGKSATVSRISDLESVAVRFPLSWSHYVLLLRRVKDLEAREFYQEEALRGGWTVRQLERQIASQFYQRALLSKNKAAMLRRGSKAKPGDLVTPEEEVKDPFVLEFLGLKDEYSEFELEAALIEKLEVFLLELGGDFTFVGRQKRLRIGDEWYRMDLVFFHRRLRCLVIIDLKVGRFTHADAGQMHLYLNYAKEHWTLPDENPPVGIILCAQKNDSVVHYALEGLPNKVLAAEYRTALPDEETLVEELRKTRRLLEEPRR